MNPVWASQAKHPHGILGKIWSYIVYQNNKGIYYEIEKLANFTNDFKILEIGYGPGYGIKYYLKKYNITYFGIDISKLMHESAYIKYKKNIEKNELILINDDFLNYDFRMLKFDRVIFANVTYFWNSLEEPFKKIISILNTNGKCIFYMTNKSALEKDKMSMTKYFNRHDIDEVIRKLKESGFIKIETIKLLNESNDYLLVEACN